MEGNSGKNSEGFDFRSGDMQELTKDHSELKQRRMSRR